MIKRMFGFSKYLVFFGVVQPQKSTINIVKKNLFKIQKI